jgi:hypothetical protein
MKISIESCCHLDTHQLKKALKRARRHESGIAGYIDIPGVSTESKASYSFDYTPEFDYLVIQNGECEQRIKLAEVELQWGARSFFVCECRRRVAKLYLPENETQFKCRHCYHNQLIYELQKINKNSKPGQFQYKTNRTLKAVNEREEIRSVFYNGKPTKRAIAWLKLCEVVGLDNYAREVEKLVSAMNG